MAGNAAPQEIGYGMKTPFERAATFFDGILFGFARGRIPQLKQMSNLIEPTTALKYQVLAARAVRDLKDPDGKFVVEIVESDGARFVHADEFTLKVKGGTDVGNGQKIAAMVIDINSSEFQDQQGKTEVSIQGVKQLIEAIVQTQARIETNPQNYLTRTQYRQLMK